MDERQVSSFPITKSATVPTQHEPTPVGNMRLTRYEAERCIVAFIAAMVMAIVVKIPQWRRRQKLLLLPKYLEPVNLSSSHVCSSDLTASHFALETRLDRRCFLVPIETQKTPSDHHAVLIC